MGWYTICNNWNYHFSMILYTCHSCSCMCMWYREYLWLQHCARIYQGNPVQMASKCWMALLDFALVTKRGVACQSERQQWGAVRSSIRCWMKGSLPWTATLRWSVWLSHHYWVENLTSHANSTITPLYTTLAIESSGLWLQDLLL